MLDFLQEGLALASMARDDPPASSTAATAAAVKWDRNMKPKLAIMRQCTSVTDRRTDGLASWHKREMYILHLALKTQVFHSMCTVTEHFSRPGLEVGLLCGVSVSDNDFELG